MMDDNDEEITQEDAWSVISAYFDEKGLVRQQIDSFDEFINNTMQEVSHGRRWRRARGGGARGGRAGRVCRRVRDN